MQPGYWLDDRVILVRFSAVAIDISPLRSVQTDPGTHSASYSVGTRGFFPRLKRPGREDDHYPTRLNIRGAIPPFPPYAYMASTGETLPSLMYCNCASKVCLLLFQQIAGNFETSTAAEGVTEKLLVGNL